jgi:hypothetical protein
MAAGILANPAVIGIITELIRGGIQIASQRTNVGLEPQGSQAVEKVVVDHVVQGIEEHPVLKNELNMEPWYQSRVTLGLIAGGIGTLLNLMGMEVSDDETQMIMQLVGALGTIAGIGYAFYGRWAGKLKPIGHA